MPTKTKEQTSEANPEVLMLGFLCVKDVKNLPEKVSILDRFGLTGIQIAAICNCAPQSAKDARQKLKGRKRQQTKSS